MYPPGDKPSFNTIVLFLLVFTITLVWTHLYYMDGFENKVNNKMSIKFNIFYSREWETFVVKYTESMSYRRIQAFKIDYSLSEFPLSETKL